MQGDTRLTESPSCPAPSASGQRLPGGWTSVLGSTSVPRTGWTNEMQNCKRAIGRTQGDCGRALTGFHSGNIRQGRCRRPWGSGLPSSEASPCGSRHGGDGRCGDSSHRTTAGPEGPAYGLGQPAGWVSLRVIRCFGDEGPCGSRHGGDRRCGDSSHRTTAGPEGPAYGFGQPAGSVSLRVIRCFGDEGPCGSRHGGDGRHSNSGSASRPWPFHRTRLASAVFRASAASGADD